MNLLELITKNDRNVQIQVWNTAMALWVGHENPRTLFTKVSRPRVKIRGWRVKAGYDTVRGLTLSSGMRVVVKSASRYWPNFARGEGVFKIRSSSSKKVQLTVGWKSDDPGKLTGCREITAGMGLTEMAVPPAEGDNLDLVIEMPLTGGYNVFLGVHRLLDRTDLYARCTGEGVQIGPGPKPQILPEYCKRVQYVEQTTPGQWQRLYGKETKVPIDPGLWQYYVVGNADNIPAEPGTLDFIFSSHVVEHLANPLGHLGYWASLLKPGGVIAAVIPDHSGCKDYVFQPSSLEELVAEYRQGSMTPTLAHYARWARHRAPSADPADILKSGRSIHVHFYSPGSMDAILQQMIREIGYRNYSVTHEQNHKDFFVLLRK